MKKEYGSRIRLSPKEVAIIQRLRDGQIALTDDIAAPSGIKMPKILIMDIETAPLEGLLWRLKTDYVPHSQLTRNNWFMLSWSAKWLFSEEIMSDVCTPKEALEEDDERIATSIWHLINEADMVVSHNGKNFDHKMLNMRWLINGLMPPEPYRVIDTYQLARSNFSFPSYSLGYITKELGISTKLSHEGMGMWKKCLAGDPQALENMAKYNDQDIVALEDWYLILRPWIKNHPNIGLYIESEEPVCSACGSKHLTPAGEYHTNVSVFKNFRCDECGSPHNRQRVNALPKELRKKLLSGIPG
jgi:hypothetical protein